MGCASPHAWLTGVLMDTPRVVKVKQRTCYFFIQEPESGERQGGKRQEKESIHGTSQNKN